jgi:glyoxylase-like metal-dependent hydrolase (beta-lactamase superfamily II)
MTDPPIKFSESVYLLGSHEFNIYLVKGKEHALIEGGVSTQLPLLLRQLERIKVSPQDIHYLIVLHAHADHVMTFPPLKEKFPWMKVGAFTASREVFNNEKLVNKFKESDRMIAHSLSEAGMGDGTVYHSSSFHYPMDLAIKEGDRIDLGNGITLRVLETPGHAPDGISLYLEMEEVVFVSDTLGIFYPPDFIKPNYFYHLGMHKTSLRKIQDTGAMVLCKGHQGIVKGKGEVQHYIDLAFKGIEEFKVYLQGALSSGKDEEEVSREFTDAYQSGVSAFFSWESNFKLSRLLIKRTLEDHENRIPNPFESW